MNGPHNSFPKGTAPKGHYANNLRVGYNAFEFVFDFSQVYAREAGARGCTRIVTSPGYAKAMITAMHSALAAFEEDFGPIDSGGDAKTGATESMPK